MNLNYSNCLKIIKYVSYAKKKHHDFPLCMHHNFFKYLNFHAKTATFVPG